jgi:hypothetical protein
VEDSGIPRNTIMCMIIGAVIAIGVAAGLFSSLGLLDTQFVLVIPLAIVVSLMMLIFTYALILSTRKQHFEFASPLEGKSYNPGDRSSGGYYRIPLYCPHCSDRIDLQSIHWIDPLTLVCQNCMGKVEADESS